MVGLGFFGVVVCCRVFLFGSLSVVLFPSTVARRGHITFSAAGNPHAWLLALFAQAPWVGARAQSPNHSAGWPGFAVSGKCHCSGTATSLASEDTSEQSPLPGYF